MNDKQQNSTSERMDRAAASAIAEARPEPFVDLFHLKWTRTKQATVPPPEFSKAAVHYHYLAEPLGDLRPLTSDP